MALFALRYVTLRYFQIFSLDSPVASAWRLLWTDYCTPYSPAVTICTAQRSLLHVPHSGHYYMYRPVVTICTTSLAFNISTFCTHCVLMCFVWIWEQTAIISLYSTNWLVCITETEIVYCAVRTGSLYIIQVMCFVWISEQTAIISLYRINWLVCLWMNMDCVVCEEINAILYVM